MFIYDGDIEPQLTPSYIYDSIYLKFYDVDIYGLEAIIKEYLASIIKLEYIEDFIILNYLGIDFESQLILYEISDKITNPLFDIILYNGKIINQNIYRWFTGNHTTDYYNICELHNKFISFIEWLCIYYTDYYDYDKIRDFIDNHGLLDIWDLIVDDHSIDICYTEYNEIIATYDLERLLTGLDKLKTIMEGD